MVMMYHLTLTIIEPLKQSLKRIKDIKKLHVNKADNIFRPTSKLFDRERGREERERVLFGNYCHRIIFAFPVFLSFISLQIAIFS